MENHFINPYLKYISDDSFDFNKIGTSDAPIPKFSQERIIDLCKSVSPLLEKDKNLLDLTGNFNVIGSIHGNINDLLKIFSLAGSPLEKNYIFLGDYVDYGHFSIEVITLLFALKVKRPNYIY